MNAFRTLRQHSGYTISGNFRDLQTLNQRQVKRSYPINSVNSRYY